MDRQIYREKSMEQLSQPEQLTGYLRVTGPGVWVVLIGIIVLLAGLFFWGIFGTIITTVTVPALVEDSTVSCYILTDDLNLSDPEVEISIGDVHVTASTKNAAEYTMSASDNETLYSAGYLSPGKNVYILTTKTDLADGYYDAVVTVERIKPISLLISKN